MTECNHNWRFDEQNIYSPNPKQIRYDCTLCGSAKYEPAVEVEKPRKSPPVDADYIFSLCGKILELEKRMIEKDAQIAHIQETCRHIIDKITTVHFEGNIVGFEVKE